MGKHKAFLKSEKAKVKLKGNKLLKAQNVTKTDFRIKKIVIKDQISESSLTDEGRKHNLKETLAKLKHHNFSIRLDALRILKEKILNGIELNIMLGAAIQGLCSMCLDMEKDIRRESFKTMTVLFSAVSRIYLEPFFDIILSYLSCAMTHIQQNIQDDSLLMLDILLKFQPKLMAIHSDRIFNNFLDMISKVTNSQNRSLAISMGNKMSTVKWRSKILQRMNELLKIIIAITDNNNNAKNNDKSRNENDHFIQMTPMHFPLFRNTLNANHSVLKLFHKSLSEKGTKLLNDDEKMKGYVDHLIPLLFQSWLEVAPSNNQDNLTGDAAFTLKQVIEIFGNIWQLIQIESSKSNNNDLLNWFRVKYYNEFQTNIFSKFPYQQKIENLDTQKKSKKKLKFEKEMLGNEGEFCIFQNMNIIYIYCAIISEKIQSKKGESDNVNVILDFLRSVLMKIRDFTAEELSCTEKTLQMVLVTKGMIFMKIDANKVKLLLKEILNLLNMNDYSNKEFKNKMFTVVSNIILDDSLYGMYKMNEFDSWISMLPKLLYKSQITQNNIWVLSKLAKQNNEMFLEALKNNAIYIIGNLPKIHVSGCENQQDGKKLIINLFFWIRTWSVEDKKQICEYIQTHIDCNELVRYFLFIVTQ